MGSEIGTSGGSDRSLPDIGVVLPELSDQLFHLALGSSIVLNVFLRGGERSAPSQLLHVAQRIAGFNNLLRWAGDEGPPKGHAIMLR
jgi:hypothetical protein